MANRFVSPNQQFFANPTTGAPLAGGKLFFYVTGTNTKLNTYSDSALTIPNPNPVILDSNGQSGSIFLQNQAYKVVLSPSTDTDPPSAPIWSIDPVWTSDFSTIAQVQVVNGNPNGQLAGTAGTAGGLPSSMAWDSTNGILYVCSTTGSSSTAVWTAVNSATTTTVVPNPQGYITPVSGTPVIINDSISVATLFYTPFAGNQIPIYNGTATTTNTFSEMALNLVAAHAASTLYDVFVFNNNGVLTTVTGPAWASSTTGSSSRGAGAGTTQINRTNGLWTNAVQITGRNGATTYTIGANLATYVGTIIIDTSPGQISFHRSYGQLRRWGAWNAYNRVPIYLKEGDPNASWNYGTNAFRVSNGNSNNQIITIQGLAEEVYNVRFVQSVLSNSSNSTLNSAVNGIGLNSTTSSQGLQGVLQLANPNAANMNLGATIIAEYFSPPLLGLNTWFPLEAALQGFSNTFGGQQPNMQLSVQYRG